MFTFNFLKEFWEVMKWDCLQYFEGFCKHGNISIGCNSCFISLIPKVYDPFLLKDFRCCMYKVFAKVLAVCLKKVDWKGNNFVQSTYVEIWSILDGPLIVNELHAWGKKVKKKVIIFKFDFKKAFESLNWGFSWLCYGTNEL